MAVLSSRYAYEGTETTEVAITRVGGTVDPTGAAQSRKIVTGANSQWLRPFQAEPYAVWNPTAGANVDVTVYGTVNAGALPLNDDIWMDVEYLTLSGAAPLGKLVNTTKSNLLATPAAVAADGSTWSNTNPGVSVTLDGVPSSGVTLSNGNLTATLNPANNNVGARSLTTKTAGKYYYEVTMVKGGSGDCAGLLTAAGSYSDFVNLTSGTYVEVIATNGNIWANVGSTGKSLGALAAGNVIGIAVDLNARLAWLRKSGGSWNGDVTADPAVGVGGVTVAPTVPFGPCVGFGGGGQAVNDAWTCNFGQSSYANAAPSGFDNWMTGTVYTPFKLTTTLNAPQPGLAGYIYARIRAAKPNATFYLDPKIALNPGSGGTSNVATAYTSSRYAYEGTETTEINITRVGGAADPTGQLQSRKIVTTANSQWLRPFKAEPYAVWNAVTGANVTVTVCGTINAGTLPNNDDIWLEVEYLGSSATPLGTIVTTTKSNVLAANAAVASDGSTWNGTTASGAPLDAVASVTGAWSLGRNMKTSFGAGTRYTKIGTAITALKDQSGSSRDFTDNGTVARRPVEATAFPANVLCADFAGDALMIMTTNLALSNFITAGSGAVVVSVIVDAVTSNTTPTYNNDAIIADQSQYMGLFARNLSGVTFYAYDWDGAEKAPSTTGSVGTAYVLMWRHNGGNQYISINGGAEVLVACGNTSALTGLLTLGGGASGSTCNCKIAEVFTTSDGSQTAALAAAISSMGSYIGVSWTPFKLTATLNAPAPGLAGYIEARVMCGKPSTTYYIDPKIVLGVPPPTNNKAIDGTAGGQFSSTSTGTVTLTTTQANDVVVLMFYHENKPGSTSPTISTVTSSHLTWTRRKTYTFSTGGGGNCQDLEIWWATASAPLSSEVITITLTGGIDDAAYHAFGVSGCPNPSSPWDTDASLPGANNSVPTTISGPSVTVSGVNTNSTVSMLIGAWGSTVNHDVTIPSGTTQVRSPQHNGGGTWFAYMGSFYQLNSSALSGASFTGTSPNSGDVWGMSVDALA